MKDFLFTVAFSLLLIVYVVFLVLKWIILPLYIQRLVETVKLDKELQFHHLELLAITEEGIDASVSLTILGTQWSRTERHVVVQSTSPVIVYDAVTRKVLARVLLSDPIQIVGHNDLRVTQKHVSVLLASHSAELKRLLRNVVIGGYAELQRMAVDVEVTVDVDVMHVFALDGVKLKKTVNLDQLTTKHVNASLVSTPTVTALPVVPQMRSIIGGCDIQFADPPNLCFSLGPVAFDILLNGSVVANASICGLVMSSSRKDMKISLHIVPAVVSDSPIRGLVTIAKSMLTGAANGTLNGILYGDWGAGATVVGVSRFRVTRSDGSEAEWTQDILSVVELEKDLDAVRKLGSTAQDATHDLRQGIMKVASDVLDVAGKSSSRCLVM